MTTEGTTAEPGAQQPTAPPALRPLVRSRNDRVLAGVAGGLGRWLDVDPVIFRVTFGVLSLFGGVGVIAYLIGYLLIPDEATGEALVSSRIIPDLRRLTQQQRALLGWSAAGVCVLIAVAGHRSTTVAVLVIVGVVAVMTVRARNPRTPYSGSSPYGPAAPGPAPFGPAPYGPASYGPASYGPASYGPASYGQQNDYAYSPPPAATVPPTAAFTGPGQATGWQPQQPYYSAPLPRFVVKSRGRRLNKVLLSATVLAIGLYLLVGSSGLYDPTVLQATAVGLTALGIGLAATAWHARSRGAMLVGVLMTAFLLVGSAVQGDYGTSMGNRTWRPTATTSFPATYKLAAGDATLDLTQLGPSALGKTVNVSMGLGKLTILVPDGLPISAYAHVDVGNYSVFGTVYGDDPVRQTVTTPGWTPSSGIRIETRLRLGDVEVDHG